MTRLADVIDAFGDDFRTQYRDHLTADHLRALTAITHCRKESSPKIEVACTACDHRSLVPHSCGHRHCPHCQHHESQQWLERQMMRLVPTDYFLVTFTLPAEFRPLTAAHPSVTYDLLMKGAWETVRTFSQNDRQLAGTPGAIAVLHTHSRRLDFHPHVHLVVPAAAIDLEQKRWRTKRRKGKGYLFNHKALAKVFRAKLLTGLTAAGLTLPGRYPTEWVVDCKSVGNGASALIYLGRYLYRGVIREQDILSCANGQVTFRYRHARTGRMEQRTLAGADFLWLVFQHVLPKGFRRARNFGFLHPNCKRLIALLLLLLRFSPTLASTSVKERAPILCACCGAVMKIVRTRIPPSRVAGPATMPAAQGAF